jgi:hypothetical protein
VTAGLDTLMSLRRSGRKPQRVSLSTHIDGHSRLAANVAEMNACCGDLCWCVAVTEPANRLDLRALQGLPVEVDGTDPERVEALAQACTQAGASRVIASVVRFDQRGTCHLVRQTDTEGIFVHG